MGDVSGTRGERIYRRMTGVRGIPREHQVVLCGVDRDGRMATGSGVDFADAKCDVDRKFGEMLTGDSDTPVDHDESSDEVPPATQ